MAPVLRSYEASEQAKLGVTCSGGKIEPEWSAMTSAACNLCNSTHKLRGFYKSKLAFRFAFKFVFRYAFQGAET